MLWWDYLVLVSWHFLDVVAPVHPLLLLQLQLPWKKSLKIGSDVAYAPFEFMDEKQQPTGFDMELIKALGADMGYTKVNIETASFDGLIASLEAGKYDAVISAMTITDKRSESVLFSDKYFQATQYIAMKKGATFKTLADLKGKRGWSSAQHNRARSR